MITAVMMIYFISSFIVVFSQWAKVNKIALKYGINVFSKKDGITPVERKIIIKAFLISFGYVIGGFVILGLIIYLSNPEGFTIYY